MRSLRAIDRRVHGPVLQGSTTRGAHSRIAWLLTLICSIGVVLVFPASLRAAAPAYSEDAVKAAFLYRFAAYIQWPQPLPPDMPFTIGVVGSDIVASHLQQLLAGKKIQGRPAQALGIQRREELAGIQVLYFGRGVAAHQAGLIAAAAAQSILVVTDEDTGLRSGGVINFLPTTDSVRFEVSLPAAKRSRLKIDSGLLSVAARVEGRPGAGLSCLMPWRGRPDPGRCSVRLAAFFAPDRSLRTPIRSGASRVRS